MTDLPAPSRVVFVERILFAVTLLAKIGCLLRQRERVIGYEVGDHLARVLGADWWGPPIKATYYAYHPPFGFAIPRLLIEWKVQEVFALQIFSTLCAIVAFLGLRMALSSLGQLKNPLVVLFLYFWAGIPILVNCGVSINMDITIFACASLALWFSIAFWKERSGLFKRLLYGTGIVLSLACAPMMKYNGVILLSIPPLVAVFFHQGSIRKLATRVAVAGALSLLAMACVLPYYYQRYYVETQSFFPRNNEFWNPDHVKRCQDIRDQNLSGFFAVLFIEGWIDPGQPPEFRHSGLMLSDAWRDFWIEDYRLYMASREEGESVRRSVVAIGSVYRAVAGLLVLLGLFTWVVRWNWEPFNRLGLVFLVLASLHIAALVYYCYLEADPDCDATKGVYIFPATWIAAFLCVQPLRWLKEPAMERLFPYAACFLAAWLAWNHLWPVY